MLIISRFVENFPFQSLRHELQVSEMSGIVVGIFVAVRITQVFHEFGWSVAKIERHTLELVFLRFLKGLLDGKIGSVALRGGGEIDCHLGKRNPCFRHTDLMHDLEACVCKKKRVRIGESDIL